MAEEMRGGNRTFQNMNIRNQALFFHDPSSDLPASPVACASKKQSVHAGDGNILHILCFPLLCSCIVAFTASCWELGKNSKPCKCLFSVCILDLLEELKSMSINLVQQEGRRDS